MPPFSGISQDLTHDTRAASRGFHGAGPDRAFANLFRTPKEWCVNTIDPAATAWLLASTALVLLMTPGLAIFYGGMVRTTGVLNMIMMSFIAIPLVTVAWLLFGYTLAFSGDERRRADRRPRARRHGGHRPRHRARFGPRTAVRHLPADLRDHHRRAGQRRDRRPRQVLRLDGVRPDLGDRRVRGCRALGVGTRRAGCSSSARSTTRAAWSSRSSPAHRHWRWRWCWAHASDSRRMRCVRTTCRSSCSASACCGSAGSASTPARRWPPTGRPRRSSSTRWSPAASACWAG